MKHAATRSPLDLIVDLLAMAGVAKTADGKHRAPVAVDAGPLPPTAIVASEALS
jgi:hypothetical protein